MAVVIPEHWGEWTVADLDTIPESSARFEIHDGNLVVSPSPASDHAQALRQLVLALAPQVPAECALLPEFEVILATTSVRVPDAVIVRGAAVATRVPRVAAAEVLVAVEIVSPSSRTTDRIVKPAEYAAAGIAGYWRIEIEPDITLTACALGGSTYRELGTWRPGEVARIGEPLAVAINVSDLLW